MGFQRIAEVCEKGGDGVRDSPVFFFAKNRRDGEFSLITADLIKQVDKLFINGEWVEAASDKKIEVINPANRKVIAKVAAGNQEDAERAIAAARKAFDEGPWKEYHPSERAQILFDIARIVQHNKEELAQLETLDNGKTLRESRGDMDGVIRTFRYYAGLCGKPYGETFEADYPLSAKVVREPIGVCALIIPWNYPLLMAAWKLAPALAAGNTCILKPSEVTPLSALRFFELIQEIDIPAGVMNLVIGTGMDAAQPLTESKQVDKVAFTGGTETGKKIMMNSLSNLKKVSLELGGKSPNIIFADADFETAMDYAVFGIFNNTGQVCSAGSRLLVEKSVYDRAVEDIISRVKQIRVGDGSIETTQMGPVTGEKQYEKVLDYINIGRSEGARIAFGGNPLLVEGSEDGYFIEPTVFVDVLNDMRIAQEEIFGPVLCVIPFENEREAVQLANATPYGLAGAVFTSDSAKAERMARKIKAGTVWLNTYEENLIEGPWGGYKQSGTGRELGVYGYEAYTEIKQIINNLDVQPTNWFNS
ncbi:aldehyde dehydrogenase family protein [Bacillus piscicola]|uniref:aldehyde dehydrogenase family protein n=1 Tax=Bacillus piscicola TaxID=1632684 RepID=UPI001F09833B|nr:aldehyde dehydrogenase family protein [Bacillus piscicola]